MMTKTRNQEGGEKEIELEGRSFPMMESSVGGTSNNDGNMSTGTIRLLVHLIRV